MTVEQDTASVAKMLRQRQKEMLVQKEEHLKQISQLNEELQRLFAKMPKKARGGASIQEFDDQINALEFKRTTSSLKLAEEKELLRQIDALKRSKMLVEERKRHEETIQEKKLELTELRDSLSLILASIDELQPVLQKVELADRLHCATTELKTITIACPKEKTRHVIGKNGSNMKKIMERTSVAMDVDSEVGQIELTGSQEALDAATIEIRRITEAVEEDVKVSPALVGYLTTRRLNTFAELREQHPDVFIDVSRNSTTVRLEGLAEDVSNVKDALLAMQVKQESRSLSYIESSVIVGKKGVTINKLTDEYKVAIDVTKKDDEGDSVSVVGLASNVDAAMAAINELLELNKDVTETIPIEDIVRSVLLNNGGEGMKKLQKDIREKLNESDGGVRIKVEKAVGQSSLLIEGRRPALLVASEVVDDTTKEIMDSVVTMQVDAFLAPRLVGKGGENIRKMKSQGDGVVIEIDQAGKVQLYGSKEDMDAVAKDIQSLIDENHVERIDCDPSTVKRLFRALIREKIDEINKVIKGCEFVDDDAQIILRGTEEQIKEASKLIQDFIAENYFREITYPPEDEEALFVGGSGNVMNKLAQEFDINMVAYRSDTLILARGPKDRVEAAEKRLNQCIYGGDGYSVAKMVVSEQAVGPIIGKGGSRRMELEEKNEGVKIFIERTNGMITIRGPDQAVQDCRTEILKIVSSIRVTDSMSITSQQHAEFSKPDVIKQLTAGIPVYCTLTESEVSVRGLFSDVRDALALLKAHLTGVYETRIELDSSQYAKVVSTCKDPSHFDRIKASTSTEIELVPSSSSIAIRGKRGNVKKAKMQVMGFLDFLLPSNFKHIKMPKAFQSTVASAASLADVSALSGASVVLDRDLNSIQVQSSDSEKVQKATDLIQSKMAEAEKLVCVVQIDKNESWIIPQIIGKGGQKINVMSKETGCRIDVDKQAMTATVSGENEESVAKAKAAVIAAIDKARRENVFIQLPPNSVASFVGKSGAHIRQFAEEHNVEVERVRKDPTKVRISGPEDSVAAAKAALLAWIRAWEEANAEVSLALEKSMIPVVLGKDGSVINEIQKESGCRIDIERKSSTVIIRGGSLEKRNDAVQKIKDIIAKEEAVMNEREEKRAREAEERAERAKAEKKQQQQQTGGASPNAQQQEAAVDSRKDRSAEFSARPVGLTQSKSKSPKNGSSRKQTNDDLPLVGTATGRNLFGLLVSDSSLDTADTNSRPRVMSTSSGEPQESTNNAVGEDQGPVYVRSASGFAVRV